MIWPFHTKVGTVDHNLSPSLYEAICYHAAARPERIAGLRILEDGMSSVDFPGIDFDAMADAAYQRHRHYGLTFTWTNEAIG